jgi:RNA polymerase sigma-70 factor (ECF subfamily)
MLFNRQSAFETMVRGYSGDLYRFVYWLCRDRHIAEDVVQETFFRAWRSWYSLRSETAVKSWLFTIARNEYARLYQRKPLDIDHEQELEEINIAHESNLDSDLALRQALSELPETYREPLLLQVLAGLSCAEIAKTMKLNEANVMTRLTRARQALRKLVEGEPYQSGKKNELS